jgi:membrane dipeptidase
MEHSSDENEDMAQPSPQAQQLTHDAIVVDLHADTLEIIRVGYDIEREHRSFPWLRHTFGHIDLPRLRRGGVTAVFFGVVIFPWSTKRTAPGKVRRQSQRLENLCERFPHDLLRGAHGDDIRRAHQEGKVATFLGVEGSHGLNDNPAGLAELARRGVRYVSPAHLFNAPAGPSSFWRRSPKATGKLFPSTINLMEQLQELSLVVDLAHLTRGPFLEICQQSKRPVLCTHTGIKEAHPVWRNIDEEQIRAVAQTGGVVGVVFSSLYLGRSDVHGVVAHLKELVRLGGEDIAAVGSDFDGLVRPPDDIADAGGWPLITDALLQAGFSERLIRKILGENALRLLDEVPPPPQATWSGQGPTDG